MDWNGNLRTPPPPFLPRPPDNSFSFFYNYNFDHPPYSVLEMKHPQMQMTQNGVLPVPAAVANNVDKNCSNYNGGTGIMNHNQVVEKKKRLTNDQLESLESSFQEEIKLDPDRKMKLARELGLQPRQIAVWFQNRRARWKNKQLERLYDSLKQEFDVVSRDKLRLQEEVLTLRNILKEQVGKNRISTTTGNYTDQISTGEETVESTSIPSSTKSRPSQQQQHLHLGECSYVFNNVAGDIDIDNNNDVINIPPPPYTSWTTTTALPIYP